MRKSLFLKLKRELPSSIFILLTAIFITQSIAPSSNTIHFFFRLPSFIPKEKLGNVIYLPFRNSINLFENRTAEVINIHLNQVSFVNNLDSLIYSSTIYLFVLLGFILICNQLVVLMSREKAMINPYLKSDLGLDLHHDFFYFPIKLMRERVRISISKGVAQLKHNNFFNIKQILYESTYSINPSYYDTRKVIRVFKRRKFKIPKQPKGQ